MGFQTSFHPLATSPSYISISPQPVLQRQTKTKLFLLIPIHAELAKCSNENLICPSMMRTQVVLPTSTIPILSTSSYTYNYKSIYPHSRYKKLWPFPLHLFPLQPPSKTSPSQHPFIQLSDPLPLPSASCAVIFVGLFGLCGLSFSFCFSPPLPTTPFPCGSSFAAKSGRSTSGMLRWWCRCLRQSTTDLT